MTETGTLEEQEFAVDDIFRLASALLEGIHRGELEASPREVEFLTSFTRLVR